MEKAVKINKTIHTLTRLFLVRYVLIISFELKTEIVAALKLFTTEFEAYSIALFPFLNFQAFLFEKS